MRTKKIARGEIHLIPFPFTDLSGNKVRPALVLGGDREDVTAVFITTVPPKGERALNIAPTKKNGIKVTSYIRYTKIATLDAKLSVGAIGVLENDMYQKVVTGIVAYISSE